MKFMIMFLNAEYNQAITPPKFFFIKLACNRKVFDTLIVVKSIQNSGFFIDPSRLLTKYID